MEDRYDMVVIGAGPAGEKAATQAAYYGHSVAVVERRGYPGGTAVSEAGIPTKTLRETALYLTGFRQRDVYGIGLSLGAELKLMRLHSRTAEVVSLMKGAVTQNLQRMGVTLVQGVGSLERQGDSLAVRVESPEGTRRLHARFVLLATGSRPNHPPGIPFDAPDVSDSEKILEIARLPKHMVVAGGGAVGCEYASIFSALGVDVVLLEGSARLLAFSDVEMSGHLAQAFRATGMRVELGTALSGLKREAGRLRVELADGRTIDTDHLLFAGGRVGNTEGLGLAEAGVETDARGRIRVDEHYRTSVPGVYAAGDLIGPPALASVSMEQGRVAACHAFGITFKEAVDPMPPYGVYSVPELAMVGLTEEAARERGLPVEVGRGWFQRNTRARIAGTTEGLIKLVFRSDDRQLLGVHILGDVAAELIHLGQVMVRDRKPIDAFIHMTFNVPTYSDAYKYAAYDGLQRLGHPFANPQ